MWDFTLKDIKDIKVGERIIAFDENPAGKSLRRKYTLAVVTKTMHREIDEDINKIQATTGSLSITNEHPVLSNGWKTAGSLFGSKSKIKLLNLPQIFDEDFSENYKLGYFTASWTLKGIYENIENIKNCNIFIKDLELKDRLYGIMKELNFEVDYLSTRKEDGSLEEAIVCRSRTAYGIIHTILNSNFKINKSYDYYRGFLAAIYDFNGTCSKDNLLKITSLSKEVAAEVSDGLKLFGVYFSKAISKNGEYSLTLLKIKEGARKFIEITKPAIVKKRFNTNSYVYGNTKAIVTKERFKGTVYNIETSSHTYIANGILVHNCYEINKRDRVISFDKAKKFLDVILTTKVPTLDPATKSFAENGMVIDFIGGDAFATPDIIDKTLEYFQYKLAVLNHPAKDHWRASISTNGLYFADERVRKLILKWKDNFSIGISIDGCPELHDLNRVDNAGVGSMGRILEQWDWIKENVYLATTSTKATLAKCSIPYIFKSLKWMHEELGLIFINQNFIMEDAGLVEEDYVELNEQLKMCAKYILENHSKDLYWSMFDKDSVALSSMSDYDRGRCGSGSMPCLSIDGEIYPCFRWLPISLGKEGLKHPMVIGNVDDGKLDLGVFEEVQCGATRENMTKEEKCKCCPHESSCAYCVAGCYAELGKFERLTYICYVNILQKKWARWYWDKYNKINGIEKFNWNTTGFDEDIWNNRYLPKFMLDLLKEEPEFTIDGK
jgi:uncharacterized protein